MEVRFESLYVAVSLFVVMWLKTILTTYALLLLMTCIINESYMCSMCGFLVNMTANTFRITWKVTERLFECIIGAKLPSTWNSGIFVVDNSHICISKFEVREKYLWSCKLIEFFFNSEKQKTTVTPSLILHCRYKNPVPQMTNKETPFCYN